MSESGALQADRKVVLVALNNQGWSLLDVSNKFRSDQHEVVLASVYNAEVCRRKHQKSYIFLSVTTKWIDLSRRCLWDCLVSHASVGAGHISTKPRLSNMESESVSF